MGIEKKCRPPQNFPLDLLCSGILENSTWMEFAVRQRGTEECQREEAPLSCEETTVFSVILQFSLKSICTPCQMIVLHSHLVPSASEWKWISNEFPHLCFCSLLFLPGQGLQTSPPPSVRRPVKALSQACCLMQLTSSALFRNSCFCRKPCRNAELEQNNQQSVSGEAQSKSCFSIFKG